MIPNIQNLEEVLQQHLENGLTIQGFTTTPLTEAGENYGSLMLSLEVTLSNNETLKLVAKMCPPNDFLRAMFNSDACFKKEIAMYREIIPTLYNFQKEQGAPSDIQLAPKFYGGRINLNNSDIVDDDAIIVLNNVKIEGFKGLDRMVGFNLEVSKSILQKLAVYHAVPIAIKILKPDLFENRIKRNLIRCDIYDDIGDQLNNMIQFLLDVLRNVEECIPLLDKVSDLLKSNFYNLVNGYTVREPFGTISHNDLWVNNILVQMNDPNELPQSLIIDFQLYDYGSMANDFIFFMYTSVSAETFNQHYDDLLGTYYNEFITTLTDLKCPTEMFTLELFEAEIQHSIKMTQLFHILTMLRHVLALKSKMKKMEDITLEDLTTKPTQISDIYRKRLPEIVLDMNRRNWI